MKRRQKLRREKTDDTEESEDAEESEYSFFGFVGGFGFLCFLPRSRIWSLFLFSAIIIRKAHINPFMPIEPVKIPQNVYVEDRIVGPVTLRQLIILLSTAGFSYAIWTAAKNQFGAASVPLTILCWVPFMIGVIFAFVRIQGIGLMRFILLMVEKMDKPAVRLWSPRRGISINFQYFSGVEEKKKQTITQPHREKLEELSALLDRGPIVTAKNEEQESVSVPAEKSETPRPVDQGRIRAEKTEDGFPFDDIRMESPAITENPPQSARVTMRDILPPSNAHA